jgi:acetyl-CoA carboxylase carboxyl transferase beta subunit/acetyl-CoA carboxylase carboxyl transferase alpha subunit
MRNLFKEGPHFQLPFRHKPHVPANLWVRCEKCHELLYVREYEKNLRVCQKCEHHARLTARERIEQLMDDGSFVEEDVELLPADPLEFRSLDQSYADKLCEARQKTGLAEALVCGHGTLEQLPLRLVVCEFGFMGGSMGSVMGEKLVRAVERCLFERLPLVAVCSSGGARMQEGVFALMQMAKTSAALASLVEARLPFISVLTDPTTGGVTASWAGLGDVLIAEPGALVGFAGPRVIEQITKQKLPPDAQRAEFLLPHGMVDLIVPRREVRGTLARLLRRYAQRRASDVGRRTSDIGRGMSMDAGTIGLSATTSGASPDKTNAPSDVIATAPHVRRPTSDETATSHETAWDRVQLARHPERPYTLDYIRLIFDDFLELHGDRLFAEDAALVGGLADFDGRTVMVIGQQKGRDTRDNTVRRFGMPRPEGYRKALRLIEQAEKFRFPLISLVDTPGADPTLPSEERGQALAIAANLLRLARVKTTTLAVVIGEGGSGGAIAIGLADRVLMMENAIYSVAAPEAAASILWRDASRAPEAAETMKITARDLLGFHLIDAVVPEPLGGAHTDPSAAAAAVKASLIEHLAALDHAYGGGDALDTDSLLAARFDRYRRMGVYVEGQRSMVDQPTPGDPVPLSSRTPS